MADASATAKPAVTPARKKRPTRPLKDKTGKEIKDRKDEPEEGMFERDLARC